MFPLLGIPIIPVTAYQRVRHKVLRFPSVYDEPTIIVGMVQWRELGAKLVTVRVWTGKRIPEE